MENEILTELRNAKKKDGSGDFLKKLAEISKHISFPDELLMSFEFMTVFPISNYEYSKENGVDLLLAELIELSGEIYLPIKIFGNVHLHFRISDKFNSKDFKKTKKTDLFLIIESNTTIDIEKIVESANVDTSNMDNIKPEFVIPGTFRMFYKSYLTQLLYMTQIVFPGSLTLGEGVIYLRNKKIGTIEGISSVLSEFDYSNNKWPKLEKIKIIEVWNYIITNTKILEEFSKTKIERAFNSYTYLFSENHHYNVPASLFWALSGLESLFVVGETGITQQLNDKIQTFLGDITENKRLLKKLYNYRSGLIHGDLSIPINNGLLNNEKHDMDLYDMNSLAAVILVSSLQKIIKENLKELKFKYHYE